MDFYYGDDLYANAWDFMCVFSCLIFDRQVLRQASSAALEAQPGRRRGSAVLGLPTPLGWGLPAVPTSLGRHAVMIIVAGTATVTVMGHDGGRHAAGQRRRAGGNAGAPPCSALRRRAAPWTPARPAARPAGPPPRSWPFEWVRRAGESRALAAVEVAAGAPRWAAAASTATRARRPNMCCR